MELLEVANLTIKNAVNALIKGLRNGSLELSSKPIFLSPNIKGNMKKRNQAKQTKDQGIRTHLNYPLDATPIPLSQLGILTY